jgi:hypothetical protein
MLLCQRMYSPSVCQFLPLSTFSASANHGLFSLCQGCGSGSAWICIILGKLGPDLDPHQSETLDTDPDPHHSQNLGTVEAQNGRSQWTRECSEWSLEWSADSQYIDDGRDPEPYQYDADPELCPVLCNEYTLFIREEEKKVFVLCRGGCSTVKI